MSEFVDTGQSDRTWVPEALELRGAYLQPETFYPHTKNKVKVFQWLVQGQLLKIFLAGENLSAEQVGFIDQTVVSSSRLIRRELQIYNLQLPSPHQLAKEIGRMPENLRAIQKEVEGLGLMDAIRNYYHTEEHHDIGDLPESIALSEEQPWLDVANELASGEVTVNGYPQLSGLLQDCASDLVGFVKVLAEENDGLAVDQYTQLQFQRMLLAYNNLLG